LDSLYYHCKKVDKELVDISIHWEPYLPATYPKPTAGPTPTNPQNPAAAPARPKLNAGSIVGIVIGVLVVLAVVLGLLRLWWNKKREAKKLRKENARLQDVTNPDGMSHRINTIISDQSFRSFADGNGSAYNDATLIGSPTSATALPTSPTSPTNRLPPFKEYGTDEQDYAMSEYKSPGHGRDYSRGHHELPNNQLRESQVMQAQRNAPDDSASEYSVRRFSYDADSVDVRQESEGRAQWERAKRAEWEMEQEQGRNRGSMR
jgi:cytoskeletal protein RodZ